MPTPTTLTPAEIEKTILWALIAEIETFADGWAPDGFEEYGVHYRPSIWMERPLTSAERTAFSRAPTAAAACITTQRSTGGSLFAGTVGTAAGSLCSFVGMIIDRRAALRGKQGSVARHRAQAANGQHGS